MGLFRTLTGRGQQPVQVDPPVLSPAQQAQQETRTSDGRYAEMPRPEATLDLDDEGLVTSDKALGSWLEALDRAEFKLKDVIQVAAGQMLVRKLREVDPRVAEVRLGTTDDGDFDDEDDEDEYFRIRDVYDARGRTIPDFDYDDHRVKKASSLVTDAYSYRQNRHRYLPDFELDTGSLPAVAADGSMTTILPLLVIRDGRLASQEFYTDPADRAEALVRVAEEFRFAARDERWRYPITKPADAAAFLQVWGPENNIIVEHGA